MGQFERLAIATRKIAEACGAGPQNNIGAWTPSSPVGLAAANSDEDLARGERESAHRAMLALTSAIDHTFALAHLIEAPDVVFAAMTTSRGALEAAAVSFYLTDPAVDSRERCRRYINDRLADFEETRRLIARIPPGERGQPTAEHDEDVSELKSLAVRLGFKVKHPSWGAPYADTPTPRIVDLARMVIGDDRVAGIVYQHLSATAHARTWGTSRFLMASGPVNGGVDGRLQGQVAVTLQQCALVNFAAPVALTNASERLYTAFGWDAEQLMTSTRLPLLRWARDAGVERPSYADQIATIREAPGVPLAFGGAG